MTPTLRDELKKRRPFDSVAQEATLALMRTTDLLTNRIARLLRTHKLTLTQYNVMRILRGEGKPMPVSEIGDRMIQVAPAVTRVVDQLVDAGFVMKTQSEQDRRVFHVEITTKAKRLLGRLDQPVLDLHDELLCGIDEAEMRHLIRTLEKIRGAID
jgi:DNA-binding MarR family transcriptional regulator